MAKKPTYEELEKKVNNLKREASEFDRMKGMLSKSEKEKTAILDSMSELVAYQNTDHKILWANKAAGESVHLPPEQLKGRYCYEIWQQRDKPCVGCPVEKAFETGRSQETEMTTLDGRSWFIRGNPIRDANGTITGGVETTLEITEHKRTEEALRESEEFSTSLLDNSPNPIIVINQDTSVRYMNRAFKHLTGFSSSEIIGRKAPYPWWTQETIMKTGKDLKEAMQKGSQRIEELFRKKNGERFWVSITSTPVRKNGGFQYYLANWIDITAHKQAEERLATQQARIRSLFEYSGEAIVLLDLENHIIDANPSFEKIFGYSPEEAHGKVIEDLICPERFYYAESKSLDEQAIHGIKGAEIIRMRKDGREINVRVSAGPIKLGDTVTGRFVIFDDITTHKQAEEALKESEEKYRTILESIEDGYFEVDIKGNLTLLNNSLCKIQGYPNNELMGMNNRNYMDEDNAKRVYQDFNRVYKTGKPAKGFEYEIIRKDTTKRHVESSVSLIKDLEGNSTGFRGIVRDITEKKQMEAELNQTKDFLKNIIDSSIDGIATADLKGIIIYTSPNVKDYLGYEQEEMIGKKIYPFYVNGREDGKKIMKKLEEKGELSDHEMKFIKKDGTLIDISLSASFLRNEKGEVIGTLGIYRDITEKKNLEFQLLEAQKMEAIGTLAGGIAHNFNNLLMSIQGNTSLMLLDIPPDHPHHDRLTSIEHAVQSGSKLTTQLLGYARRGGYEVKPLNINDLIEETSATFSTTRKDITIHQDLGKDLFGIIADQGQIEQILLNLFVNAADAMPQGGDLFLKTMNVTHVNMKNKPYKPVPGNYALLTVTDTGVGMDTATQAKIFDPFFTTKEMGRGTGLGLASVYGIVKAHGGYIDVESKKGKGTTFTLYLPASKAEKRAQRAVSGKRIEIEQGTETILLVDDEEMVLNVGEQMLTKLGYIVLTARGGKEAIQIYEKNQEKIDLVILDMIMPGMGGGETYDRMKEIHPSIKVLLSSGYSIDGQAKEILKRGCNGFIQKPFTMRQVSQRIREVLVSESGEEIIKRP